MAGKKLDKERFRIWHEQHVGGNSTLAAENAHLTHSKLPEPNFSQADTNAEHWTDLSRQVVVASVAAARNESHWVRAYLHLHRAAETILSSYPLATNPQEAIKRAAYWNASLRTPTLSTGEKASAVITCLRDLAHLSNALESAYNDGRFAQLKTRILEAVGAYTTLHPFEPTGLMLAIEERSAAHALEAFEIYHQEYAPELDHPQDGSPPEVVLRANVHEYDTVSARATARAFHDRQFGKGFELLRTRSKMRELFIEAYQHQLRGPRKGKDTTSRQFLSEAQHMSLRAPLKETLKPLLSALRARKWQRELTSGSTGAFNQDAFRQLLDLQVDIGEGDVFPLGPKTR